MEWSEHEVAELVRLWNEGFSAAQVANKLGTGRTRNAIIGRAHRMGLRKNEAGRAVNPNAIKTARIKARPPRQPKPPRVIAAAEPMPEYVPLEPIGGTIAEAGPYQCRWINGDPADNAPVCGRHAEDGRWCAHHKALVYQPAKVSVASIERFAHWSDRNRINSNMAIFGGSL